MHQRSYIEHCFRENDMELMKGGVTLPNVDEKGSPEAPIDQYGHPTKFEKSKSNLSEIYRTTHVACHEDKTGHFSGFGGDCLSDGH